MGSDIFGSSVSALNTAQIGMATTEHNIANVNTPGYSRQEVMISARAAQQSGAGYIGQGSDVGTIRRIYDDALSGMLTQQQGQAAKLNSYYAQVQHVNNMVADPNAGLAPALQDFFNAVNGVSAAPESMPARQTMLSNAQALSSRFQSLNQQLANLNSGVNSQIYTSTQTINGYAKQIAALNQSVVLAQASNPGQPPNDLLDQRDQALAQLNQELNVSVVKQGDGSYNVTVGNGQLLVSGATAYTLQPITSPSDPTKLDVAYNAGGGVVYRMTQSDIQGGNLGGLLTFRSQSLDTTQNSLGMVAMGMAGTFNQQHQLGQDMKGVLGGNFFAPPAVPVVNMNTANTGTAVIGATVSNYAALTGSDYSLTYVGGATGYSLTRLSDNTTSTFATAAALSAASVDGLTFSVAGAPAVNDSFLIRPTVNGAINFAVAVNDPAKIAAAAPIRTNAILTNAGDGKISAGVVDVMGTNVMAGATGAIFAFSGANATFSVDGVAVTVNQDVTVGGTGPGAGTLTAAIQAGLTAAGLTSYSVSAAAGAGLKIVHAGSTTAVAITGANAIATGNGIVNSAGTVGPIYTAATVTPAVTLTYNSATNTLTGFPALLPVTVTNNGVATAGSPFAAGAPVTYTNGATISFGGASFTLTGTPANGDQFTIAQNTNASSDNRNSLLLAGLQTQNTMLGGTASYLGVYSQLVSLIGNKTRELEVTSTAQNTLVTQTRQAQQSVSGVNLDEEAANLLRYQRAYQAAGKAMQIASTMFDTLLSLGR